jgi:menaquinone-dependent protoporphyrinogen oxidase
MRILVAVASKHGSTLEIAEAIGATLKSRGHDVDVVAPNVDLALRDYGAVVCGSAVYGGSWRPDAVRFLEYRADDLRALPVWLFESGPVGNPDLVEPMGVGRDFASLVAARDLAVFDGRIDRSVLSMGEKAIITMVRVKDDDLRDFDAIEEWAESIGDALQKEGGNAR